MFVSIALAAALSARIVCSNLAAERRFYTAALGFEALGEATNGSVRIARLRLGRERVDLIAYPHPGAAISRSARSTDRDFQHLAIIVSDMPRAWSRVASFGIRTVSVAPQTLPAWNPNAGGIAAVYFRDPEGHPLELLHFPEGKGEPRWHAARPLFLGIDHTAIAVTDPRASTRFYRTLGLAVRGHSNNYGIEQERLSGIPHAHVAITGLRFLQAPGVEFLHYLRPSTSQPPETARFTDLVATRTRIVGALAASVCRKLRSVVRDGGCFVRDPDGHIVELATSE